MTDPETPDDRGWSVKRAAQLRSMQREQFTYDPIDPLDLMPWRQGPVVQMAADGPNCPAHPSEPVFECLPCSEMGD